MLLHARQFVLGPRPLLAQPEWLHRKLPGGWHLSHSPTLPVRNEGSAVVLGIAIPTCASNSGEAAWAGRWALIAEGRLRTDHGAMLSCFYRDIDAQRWISSSPEILRALPPELPLPEERLGHDWRVMDWYPPPLSGIAGIRRLLPSQTMRLADGRIEHASLLIGNPEGSYESVLERLSERLVAAVKGAAAAADALGGPLYLALTGGQDSRLVLAAAAAAQVDVTAFTFNSPHTGQGDRELPPRLAAAVGFPHVAVLIDAIDPGRQRLFDQHTALHKTGAPRFQISAGGWDRLPESAVTLEGGCFEVGRGYYYGRLPPEMGPTAEATLAIIVKCFPAPHASDIKAWVDWIRGPGSEEHFDWRDRFYLEQRIAGWLSSNAQGADLSGRHQVHIANCQALVSDLLLVPHSVRRRGVHHRDLIARLAPSLNEIPLAEGRRSQQRGHGAAAARRSLLGRLRDRGSRLVGRQHRL